MSGTQQLRAITTTQLLATDPAAVAAIAGVANPAGATAGAAAASPFAAAASASAELAATDRSAAANAAVTAGAAATAADIAAAAALTASPIYADTAAGLAAVAEGATFSVQGSGLDFAILYRKTAGAAVELSRYPSKAAVDAEAATRATAVAGVWFGLTDARRIVAGAAVLPAQPMADREILPEETSYDLRVRSGRWADTGLPWTPDGRYGLRIFAPDVTVGWRQMRVEEWSYDLRAQRGRWLDSGLPWAATGEYDRVIPVAEIAYGWRTLRVREWSYDLTPAAGAWADTGLPWDSTGQYDRVIPVSEIDVDGRTLLVELWSYDLRPVRSVWADTGEPGPEAEGAASAYPPMLVDVVDAGTINIYLKRGRPSSATYLQWRLRLLDNPAINGNVWRTDEVYVCTRTLAGVVTVGQQVFTGGEVETAIFPSGAIDFAGGELHGNEELSGTPLLLVDGAQTAISAGTYECAAMELYQTSDFLTPGSTQETKFVPKGAAFVTLYKRWRFTPAGLSFSARVVPQASVTIATGFIGMAPLTRPLGQIAIRPPYYAPEDVSFVGAPEPKTNSRNVQISGPAWGTSLTATGYWTATSETWVRSAISAYTKGYLDVLKGTAIVPGTELDASFELTIDHKEIA